MTQNHHCTLQPFDIPTQLACAKTRCEQNGVRFTALRQDIYELILQASKPLGAYDLIYALQNRRNQNSTKSSVNIAPPTVYRSLEFLLAQGLIHKLSSINAYVPCCHPRQAHVAAFLICENCHSVQEFSNLPVNEIIDYGQGYAQFQVNKSMIELSGLCRDCQV